MRKHLKEALVPPDHINISLTAGISEMIEVMMAKNRDDRYSNVQDLLMDLNAVRNGESPLRARKKFQVDALGKLEQGRVITSESQEKTYSADTIMRYKIALLGMGAFAAVLIVFIFYLLTSR